MADGGNTFCFEDKNLSASAQKCKCAKMQVRKNAKVQNQNYLKKGRILLGPFTESFSPDRLTENDPLMRKTYQQRRMF